jgi:branched-chain amino acid transport system substrate-binding protein
MNFLTRVRAFALALVALGAVGVASAQEIKIGGIFDLTGITSDVGKPYAQGVRDYVEFTNASGGINGKKVKLIDVDYGYKIPEAVAAYKRLTGDEDVLMISGWGTGDTEALKNFVNNDKIPYFSASFSAHLTDPSKTPYNFFVGPSYSDQLRAWLMWVKDDWKDASRKPRVSFIFGDNPYGRSPLAAGKAYAKDLGIEVASEEVVPGNFQDATSQLLNMQKNNADYAYINVTTTGASIILKDAQKLGLKIKFGSNPFGFSEKLPEVARASAEGVTGVMPHVPYGTDVPGMKAILDFNKGKTPKSSLDAIYVRGWATASVWVEAIRRADKVGNLSGDGIKASMETMNNFSVGGLTGNLTYSTVDHRPSTRTPIYMVQNGKLVKVKEYELPRKKEWLGM